MSKTVDNPLDLNSRQISALQRLFQKPPVLDYTEDEFRLALGIFGCTLSETSQGGRVSFPTKTGSRTVVTFHRSHTTVQYVHLNALRKTTSALAADGFISKEIGACYGLSPSHFDKFKSGKDFAEQQGEEEFTTRAVKEKERGTKLLNTESYRISSSCLALLDSPVSQNALCRRLAGVAVNFYGTATDEEKIRQVETILKRNPSFLDDALFLCRLWEIERNPPPLKADIGLTTHFAKPFQRQNLEQAVLGLRAQTMQTVARHETGKTEKLTEKIRLRLLEVEKALQPRPVKAASPMPQILTHSPIIVPAAPRANNMPQPAPPPKPPKHKNVFAFKFQADGVIIPRGAHVDTSIIPGFGSLSESKATFDTVMNLSYFGLAVADLCEAVANSGTNEEISSRLSEIAEERRKFSAKQQNLAGENNGAIKSIKKISTEYAFLQHITFVLAAFERADLKDNVPNPCLRKDYTAEDIRRTFSVAIGTDDRTPDTRHLISRHLCYYFKDFIFFTSGFREQLGIDPHHLPNLFAKVLGDVKAAKKFSAAFEKTYLDLSQRIATKELLKQAKKTGPQMPAGGMNHVRMCIGR